MDVTAALPDGRAAVRLTVARPDTAAEPLVWERPF